MTVDDPLVTILVRVSSNERRITARNLWFGHCKARARSSLAERAKIFFFLFRSRPVKQCVLIALVRCLRIEHEWPDRHLGCLSRDCRHCGWTESHPTPFRRHVRQPELGVMACLRSQVDDGLHNLLAIALVDRLPARSHNVVHECANTQSHVLDFGREREVDHASSVAHQRMI